MTRGVRFAGWIAQADGRPHLAFRFLNAVEAEHRRIRYVDPPSDIARSTRALASARGMLDDMSRDTPTKDAERTSLPTVLNEAVDYLHEVAVGLPSSG